MARIQKTADGDNCGRLNLAVYVSLTRSQQHPFAGFLAAFLDLIYSAEGFDVYAA
ncbi:MAG TPA: hypothetical protein VFP59_05730 [Candidatus Angelobacter sp.]|nr:hypothetical protein [Candidatus Angelobacter sp.]